MRRVRVDGQPHLFVQLAAERGERRLAALDTACRSARLVVCFGCSYRRSALADR
ncbi:hypothetical protein [Streptomyces lincolnensis]|uniref:hypothetical protein n=1 Tax=Streptomyces lincolnensis TaxID=1915 RepID=UPI001E35B221|nr:hypothetical protein [Streptomyces lincolnensis]